MRNINTFYSNHLKYIIVLLIVFIAHQTKAQCSGLNQATITYDFGTGTPQFSQLEPSDFGFNTTYDQEKGNIDIRTNDGEFSFVNLVSNPWGVWHDNITDHTGDGGYLMMVNADYDPGEFYRDTVSGLCSGINYEFSVWIGNLDHNNHGPGRIKPNVRFEIRDPATDDLLAFYESGDIQTTPNFTWERHAVDFDATTDEVILLLINNNDGGSGNDLALDDVSFTPCLPVYNISGDTILCEGDNLNLSADLITSAYASPEYLWQRKDATGMWQNVATTANLSMTITEPTDSGWYRVLVAEVGNVNAIQCRSTDSVYVVVSQDFDPGSISESQTICYNTSPSEFVSTQDASSLTETISYQWETSIDLSSWNTANSTSANFQEGALTSDQHYRRKAETACYTQYSDTISISVLDSLTNNTIANDQIVCDEELPDLITITSLITGGEGSYSNQWQSSLDSITWSDLPSETSTSYQGGQMTTDEYIRLQTTDGCGLRNSNVIKLDHQITPPIDTFKTSICEGDDLPSITITGSSIQWYDENESPITPPTFDPNMIGIQTYLASQTIVGCESELAPVSLEIFSRPNISVNAESICNGDSVNMTPLLAGGNGVFNFEWKDLSNAIISSDSIYVFKGSLSATFEVKVIDRNACSDSTDASVTVFSKPELTLADTSLCDGNSITITPNITSSTGTVSYEWFDNVLTPYSSNPDLFFSESTSTDYTLVATDDNLCKDTAHINITVNPKPVLSLDDESMCDGDKQILSPIVTNAAGTISYSWFDNTLTFLSSSEDLEYSQSASSNFRLIIEDENQCLDTAFATITVFPKPSVSISNESLCEGESVALIPSISNATGIITYNWSDLTSTLSTANNYTYKGVESGTIELMISDENNCKDTTQAVITVHEKPNIEITGGDICSGAPSSLQASVSNFSSGLNYLWSPTIGLSSSTYPSVEASPSSTTTYLLTVSTSDNCIDTLSYTVGVTSTPTASILGNDTILCQGQSVTYDSYNDPNENYSSEWFFSETSSDFESIQNGEKLDIDAEGYYRILVRNEGFCPVWSDIVFVEIENIEVELATNTPLIYLGETATITAHPSDDVQTLTWSTDQVNITSIKVSPEETKNYQVEASGKHCTASDQISIEVRPPIIIPNGFSPNGDLKNDEWYIQGLDFFPSATVILYNRWGNVVYRYDYGYDFPWPGINMNGEELPVATYYYVIHVNDEKNQTFNGSVSIIR